MRRVIFTERAARQIDEIVGYIALDKPRAAQNFGARLRTAALGLADFPDRGRLVAGGARELTQVRPYIIRYRVKRDVIEIVSVRHGARRR